MKSAHKLVSKLKHSKLESGFTLIELLIVVGILGVLASAILVALNPLEQFARGRDAGRLTAIDQLGGTIQSYATSQNSSFPTQGATWMTALQTSSEIKSLPSNPSVPGYTTGCYTANVAQNGICYQTNGTDAIAYVRAESTSNVTKAACTTGQIVWIVWSSAAGKSGLTCTAANTDPAVGVTNLR